MSDLDPAVYREAADVLRTGGWTRGSYEIGSAHCAVGALRVARGQNALTGLTASAPFYHLPDEPWAEPLAALLGVELSESVYPTDIVTVWNDEPERTAEDVITLLEQAAEKLEADQ